MVVGDCWLILILAGGLLAHFTQTAGGIKIQDVRFKAAKGNTMSALLYIPPNATAQTPAPGILAVHGYINSRETQDGFAIEFARRGYVVLALDQTGHGYSDPPAFAGGFGGPDGLAYLRSLEFVDKNNIGLEGHSMGGWTCGPRDRCAQRLSVTVLQARPRQPFAADGTTLAAQRGAVFAHMRVFDPEWGVASPATSPRARNCVPVRTQAGGPGQGLWRHRAGYSRCSNPRITLHPSHFHGPRPARLVRQTLQGSRPPGRYRSVPQGDRTLMALIVFVAL